MKLDRLGDITSELSANLVKSMFLPGGLLEWLSKPLVGRNRDKAKATAKSGEAAESLRNSIALGPTVLLGGAPVPDEAVVAILHLAGGRAARLAVVPVAAEQEATATAAAEEGIKLFTRFGMRRVELLELTTRERADSPEWATKLAAFDAVLLVGDNGANGVQVLRDTVCAQTLREMQAAGKPVSGLNAGAAILAEKLLLADGNTADGLGLVPGLIVETDFTGQSRFTPMVKALNQESAAALMGMGLDAGAAAVIRDGESKVLGDTSVTFIDPRDTSAASEGANGAACAMCGLKVHVLLDGFLMNLRTRKPSGPSKESQQVVGGR